ncbi:MAG: GNAT family N-acetyltransferase, partial [Alphaproteobacteria bacterium]
DAGAGANLNLPLPETITAEQYRAALAEAMRRIARFRPAWLIVACGFDTAVGDPTGSWPHRPDDFVRIGQAIGEAGLPILVVQEGGYRTRTLGQNAAAFFRGLWDGAERMRASLPEPPRASSPAGRSAPRTVKGGEKGAGIATEWRTEPAEADIDAVRRLVASTGFFTAEEIDIAAELVAERVRRGPASGYHFVVASRDGRLVGYACFGDIPGTTGRHDLYWIAVDPDLQGLGLGREILRRAEEEATRQGAARLYVDTSTSARYAPTRAFYRRAGYRLAAELPDFFRDGDGKAIFVKTLAATGS